MARQPPRSLNGERAATRVTQPCETRLQTTAVRLEHALRSLVSNNTNINIAQCLRGPPKKFLPKPSSKQPRQPRRRPRIHRTRGSGSRQSRSRSASSHSITDTQSSRPNSHRMGPGRPRESLQLVQCKFHPPRLLFNFPRNPK